MVAARPQLRCAPRHDGLIHALLTATASEEAAVAVARITGMEANGAEEVPVTLRDLTPVLDVRGGATWRVLSISEPGERADRARMRIFIGRSADRRVGKIAAGRPFDLAG